MAQTQSEGLDHLFAAMAAGGQVGFLEIMAAIEDVGAYVLADQQNAQDQSSAPNESADYQNYPVFQRCQSCDL